MALVWKPMTARFWLMLKKVKSSSVKDFTWKKFFRLNIFCILLSLNQKVMVESTLNYPINQKYPNLRGPHSQSILDKAFGKNVKIWTLQQERENIFPTYALALKQFT